VRSVIIGNLPSKQNMRISESKRYSRRLVNIPTYPHRRIGSKYVFKVKMKNGVIEKYKVRIVAKGYNQILDFD